MATLPQARNDSNCQAAGLISDGQVTRLELLTPEEALKDPAICREWESLSQAANPLYRVFTSPRLYEHATRVKPRDENRVAILRDVSGRIAGICPIVIWNMTVPFIVRRRIIARFKLRAATILGGQPLVPDDAAVYRLLFSELLKQLPWCDCVYIDSILCDSYPPHFFYEGEGRRGPYLLYPGRPERRDFFYLEPGGSMDAFLKEKQKRTRNTLKRRVRKLAEHGQGRLECARIETPEQVEAFYQAASEVAERSWQERSLGSPIEDTARYHESLALAARLGCLRAYLLKCNGAPCAFVIGYQEGDVFHLEQTAYAEEWQAFSPGTVLYFMMMEDLYAYRPPKLLNFGTGINPHKRLFSNRSSFDTALFVLRPTLRNRIQLGSYGLFKTGLRLAKSWMKKTAAKEADDDE